MKTNDELFHLIENSKKILLSSSTRKGPFTQEENVIIRNLNFHIKDNFSTNYCKPIKFKETEIDVLHRYISDYLNKKQDNFDNHYIQLLAWNIFDLKPISKKIKGKKTEISYLEYEPGVLNPNPVTKKIFKLFMNHYDCKERIGSALLMVYLNNYDKASEYYTELLKKYLKSTRITRNINLFFNVKKVGNYAGWKIFTEKYKSFNRRMELLNIRSAFFNTKYFQDAWYYWMKNKADVLNPYIINDLSCRYFDVCSNAEKIMILSKIICKHNSAGNDIKKLFKDNLEILFPVNPYIPENWIFQCDVKDLAVLIEASNIIQRKFFKKPVLLGYSEFNKTIDIFYL